MGIGLGSNYISPVWQGTKNFSRSYLHFVLGVEQSDKFSTELQDIVRGKKDPTTKKRVGGQGLKEFRKSVKEAWGKSKTVVEGKPFWGTIGKSFKKMPNEFKAAGRLARMTGKKSKFIGASLKILGKRMPFIMNIVMLGTEVPNIYRAFSQGGVGTGFKEVGKTAVKFGAFAAGAAIGQAIIPIPFVGALIGGAVAGWLADKVVGKSFTEKKEEAEAAAAATQQNQEMLQKSPETTHNQNQEQTQNQEQNFAGNTNPFEYNPMMNNSVNNNMNYNMDYSGMYNNPFYKQNYMDQDFMAMNAGFTY